ncbi:MAG: YkgJ family cysteine cluster protein [Bacteroidales bacterium]|jgi:Fe-S-cluster containining protein|nr:YkgJ family cysteine cluster protein [Bacteroidales bacterium]
MIPEHHSQLESAVKNRKIYQKFVKDLKKKPPRDLDEIIHAMHDEAFQNIDCLQCGNCCRALGPRLSDRDITALAKHLRISPGNFTAQHLCLDDDRDYVFTKMPCLFLDADNYCQVYKNRPKACGEYPHMLEARMHQFLNLALKNAEMCPAVAYVLEKLLQKFDYNPKL